jgi:uncharacterized membrane protein
VRQQYAAGGRVPALTLGYTPTMTFGTPDLPSGRVEPQRIASPRLHVVIAAAAGGCAAGLVLFLAPWELAPLSGWDVAAVSYVAWTWVSIWNLDAEHTARQAVREDPGRAASDALVLAASVSSLLAVGLVIIRAGNSTGTSRIMLIGLSVASVVFSWSVVHTLFTLRYARLYHSGPDGGVDFHQVARPRFTDFAYLAFTIGMTFQVSDTDLTTTEFRAAALRHALLSYLSYLFGTVVIATMINLVAGLTR